MKVILNLAFVLILTLNGVGQKNSKKLSDCNREKDRVYIDWTDEVNKSYREKSEVKKLSNQKLRSLYCQNVLAKERIESGEQLITKGGFLVADEDEKYLVFSIDMGDLVYNEKLYMHVGPRQKLVSK